MRDNITATLTVPITPNSELKNMVQLALNKNNVHGPDGGETLVLETAGTKISYTVPQRAQSGCQHKEKCLIDSSANCASSKAVYRAVCNDCPPDPSGNPPQYIGTTGSTIHSRSCSHKSDIKSNKISNSLAKHNNLHHTNDRNHERFTFYKISSHNSVLNRELTESYLIHTGRNLINSRKEYSRGKWISLNWEANPT